MSDQTPHSSEGLKGPEPSMEDILASIRKIISDDEPVALESPEDVRSVDLIDRPTGHDLDNLIRDIHVDLADLTSDAVLTSEFDETESFEAEGDSVDLNIDEILADLDNDDLQIAEVEALSHEDDTADSEDALSAIFDDFADEPKQANPELTNNEDLNIASAADVPADGTVGNDDDDIFALLNDDISFEDDDILEDSSLLKQAIPNQSEVDVFVEVDENNSLGDDDVEFDALLDDILLGSLEDENLVESEIDVSALALSTAGVSVAGISAVAISKSSLHDGEALSDLEMVKSLMADLTDDTDDVETEDELEALLAIPEVDVVTVEEISDSEEESDVLGDILNMTLDDEMQSHPDDLNLADLEVTDLTSLDGDLTSLDNVLAAQQENITENTLPIDELLTDTTESELPSLSDIAAAAEADAVNVESVQAPQAIALMAGLTAALGGTAFDETDLIESKSDDDFEDELHIESVFEGESQENDEIVKTFETSETYIEPTHISTQETSMPVKAVKSDAILDDVTEAAAAGVFAELNQVVEEKAVFNERGPRIGDLVQDALRPMVKEWLDANLKGIVERAVTKEVKRISKGG